MFKFDKKSFKFGTTMNKVFKTIDFQEFMKKVEKDFEYCLLVFLEAKNKNYNEIVKAKIDLDSLFLDSEDYKEFKQIYNKARQDIEKVLYSEDNGIVAKRNITNAIFSLKNYIIEKYPNTIVKQKIKKPMNKFLKWFLIILAILFFIGLFSDKNQNNINTQGNQKVIQK